MGIRMLLSLIGIEPAIFLQTVAVGLSMVINQNLILEKVCRDLDFSVAVCNDIDNYPVEESDVQTEATELQMTLSMMTSIPGIVLALFIGPWSDKNGRKPVMLLPLIGNMLSTFMWIANVYFKDASAKYVLLTGISSLFGGLTCFMIGLFSYLADITSVESRTTRIAILDCFLFGGLPLGLFLSAYIFKYFSYYGIYTTVLILQMLSILYVSFFVSDTRGPTSSNFYQDPEASKRSSVKRYLSIVNLGQLVDVFKVAFRRRGHNFRRVILILIFLMLLNVTVFSDGGIMYLYARKKFKWDEQEYTKFSTSVIVISAIAALIVMPLLSSFLKVHDAMIGIIATLSKVSSLIVISIAKDGWVLFFGACLGFLSSLSAIVIRSMLSKCVSKSELGKIYSLLASLEAAVPLFASPLFTLVYNSTLDTFTGAVFLVQAAIFIFVCINFCYVLFLLTRTEQDYSMLVEEDEDSKQDLLKDPNDMTTYGAFK